MKAATAKKAPPKADAMERYIGEIDRFAGMLRTQQEKIRDLEKEVAVARTVYDEAKDTLREAKENEHCTVSLLLLIVMATNLEDQLDPALMSRVEMKLRFEGPTAEQCEKLIQYWAELLCKHGSDEWGPPLVERVKQTPATSFRELQQTIAWLARDWVAAKCK